MRNDMSKETKVYGASDDLIEFEGGFNGEANPRGDEPELLMFSDGTLLEIHYSTTGIWRIDLVKKGDLFDRLEKCEADGEGDDYSDVAWFRPGIKKVYSGSVVR